MRKTTPHDVAAAQADFRDLSRVLSSLPDAAAVERFLRELCTPAECVDLAKRWKLMQELLSGKTQRAVARELGMSLCRITRGARYAKSPDSILAASARARVAKAVGRAVPGAPTGENT